MVCPYYLGLTLHSSVFSQEHFSSHADGGNALLWRRDFYEHLDFICATSWTLGMRYVQRGHDLPHLSFSGNESYLELKAENCLL